MRTLIYLGRVTSLLRLKPGEAMASRWPLRSLPPIMQPGLPSPQKEEQFCMQQRGSRDGQSLQQPASEPCSSLLPALLWSCGFQPITLPWGWRRDYPSSVVLWGRNTEVAILLFPVVYASVVGDLPPFCSTSIHTELPFLLRPLQQVV